MNKNSTSKFNTTAYLYIYIYAVKLKIGPRFGVL